MRLGKIWAMLIVISMTISGLAFLGGGTNPDEIVPDSDKIVTEPTDIPTTGLLRTVLWEDHTNSRCGPCVAVEEASVPVLDHYYNDSLVAPLYPHMWWPAGNDSIWLYSAVDAFDRNQYYGSFTGVPHIRQDGAKIRHRGGSGEVYWSYFNHALGQLTRFSINTSGDLGLSEVSAVVEAHEVIEPNPNRVIRFGFWETDIDVIPRFGWKGQYFTTYHWAMWDMLPDAVGEPVFPAGANPGDKAWFNRTFTIEPGMVLANLGVSIFIQDDNTQRVEQAAIENFQPDEPLPAHELATYGLECDGDPLHTYEGPHNYVKAGKTVQVNGTVCNYGDNVETNIQVDLVIEGAVEQTKYITSLNPGYGELVTFDWTVPTVAGFYDVGVQCELIGGEANITNNIHEKELEVRTTPDITYNPGSFDVDVLEGEVGFDNLTLGNDGLSNLDYEINVGSTADIIGSRNYGSLWVTSYDCGNVYSVDTSTTLVEIKMYLRITANRQLYYLVYEGDTIGGTYTKIHETNITSSGIGEKWFTTGPINVPLQAGKFYYIVLQYQFNVEWFYEEPANDPVPFPVSFGTMESGSYGNSIGLPPAATISDPRRPRGAIHQALITNDGSGSWLSTNPSSGSISPSSQTDVMLTADATSLAPGNYQTRLCVWNNDPDYFAVHVPVNLTVHQLATMLIPVQEGWNFISTPLVPGDDSVPNVLLDADGDTNWTTLQYYDPTELPKPWKSWSVDKPPFLNDLTSVNVSMGVWLYIEPGSLGDGYINVSGLPPTSTIINLKAGWNMVGYPAIDDTNYDVLQLMTDTGATDVEGFNPAAPYLIEVLAGNYVLKRGEAYWINVNSDTVWTVNW